MIKPVRGAAFAVAAFVLAISAAWGDPLQAWQGDAIAAVTPWSAHAGADPGVSELGLNDAQPQTGGALTDAATSLAEHMTAMAGAEAPTVRSLDEQVADLADIETNGDEEHCLASAVYFEARGESIEGQLAVAEVVMNRAASGRYPASLCGVVRQRSQFSFVRRGSIPHADRGSEAWRRAVAIARIAKTGAAPRLLSENVLWYHANYVSPRWGRRLARNARIGLHVFYS